MAGANVSLYITAHVTRRRGFEMCDGGVDIIINISPKNMLLKQQAQNFLPAMRGTELEELVHFAVLLCVQVAPTFRPELAQL